MKITDISVDGFGIWYDKGWSLGDGVNLFIGPNEAGKTTLMKFVRSVLFGFETGKDAQRYEPLGGGNHGGSLGLRLNEKQCRVQRKASKLTKSGEVLVHRESGIEGEEALDSILGGTTPALYSNVFAFGLEELEDLRNLEKEEIASYIYGAGMGVGAKNWTRLQKKLKERSETLFAPKGKIRIINKLLDEFESVSKELDRSEAERNDHETLVQELLSVEKEIQHLEGFEVTQSKLVDHYKKVNEAESHLKNRIKIEKQLEGLEKIESFPEGGAQKMELLLSQRDKLQEGLKRIKKEKAKRKEERDHFASDYNPKDLVARTNAVESLRGLKDRLKNADRKRDAVKEQREVVAGELATISSAASLARPPSDLAIIVFMLLVSVVGAVFWRMDQPLAASVIGGVLGMVVWIFGRKRRKASRLDEKVEACRERLEVSDEKLRLAEQDVKKIQSERSMLRYKIKDRTGRNDCDIAGMTSEDIDSKDIREMSSEIRSLEEKGEKIKSIDEDLKRDDRQLDEKERELTDHEEEISLLLESGGAARKETFFRHSDIYKERRKLLENLNQVPSGKIDSDDPALKDIDSFDPEAYKVAEDKLEECNISLKEKAKQYGGIQERIRSLERSEDHSRARMDRNSIKSRIEEASEEWAVLNLSRTLLEETRKKYEADRQPEVLRSASGFFRRMSGGRYVRVISQLDSVDMLIERDDGTHCEPRQLSRGAQEQLYLAVRLALIKEYSRDVEPLPIIFDDIFVNFDPERTLKSIEVVRDLAETHQILFFTCHPDFRSLVSEIIPEAQVFTL